MYYFKFFDERWKPLRTTPITRTEHKGLPSAVAELLTQVAFFIDHNFTFDKKSEKTSRKALNDKLDGIFTDTNETPIVFTDGTFKYELYLIKAN